VKCRGHLGAAGESIGVVGAGSAIGHSGLAVWQASTVAVPRGVRVVGATWRDVFATALVERCAWDRSEGEGNSGGASEGAAGVARGQARQIGRAWQAVLWFFSFGVLFSVGPPARSSLRCSVSLRVQLK